MNNTATRGTAPDYDPEAELEIGDGNGHGGTLGWLWLQPGKDEVTVLSVQFDEGLAPLQVEMAAGPRARGRETGRPQDRRLRRVTP